MFSGARQRLEPGRISCTKLVERVARENYEREGLKSGVFVTLSARTLSLERER